MKALVLAGGFPQIDLIEKLKARGIRTLLADYYEQPVAKDHADEFYQVSTLDVDAIRELCEREAVDFLITVCTDQALLTVAQISEELGLPCYIDYQTARNVTNKAYMKSVMMKNHIPTARFMIAEDFNELKNEGWQFPLIVKPVDCNSSKGVVKARNERDLRDSFELAVTMSRTGTAIVEEFIEGKEISVDAYVDNGEVRILDITTSEKLKKDDQFIIFRTWHPAETSDRVKAKVAQITQQIADAFGLRDTPMLIQLLVRDDQVYVIEFSARTGGGVKHLSIKRRTGFDVISAVIDLTLGIKPQVEVSSPKKRYMVDEYIYCKPGEFDHLDGFEELKAAGTMLDYYLFRWKGSRFDTISSSGDRIGGFSIEADTIDDLQRRHEVCNAGIRAVSVDGTDMIRHDLLQELDIGEA